MSQVVARRLLATTPRAERVIRLSANSLTIREGASATLRVRLSSRPRMGQMVTVTAMSNAVAEATVSPGSRQFNDQNWGTFQDFTISGVEDADGNDENTSIVLAATGGGYDDTAAVAVTVEDDENKGLRLSDMSLTVGGTVTSRTIGVRLRTEPTGDVDVAASVTGNLVSVSPTSRTFTQSTWNDQQIFTVNLDDTTGSGSSILALDPSGADYAAVATVNVPITIEASIPGEVTNVMATVRKHERLTIGWNAASLATSYNFRFKKSTAANWTNRTGLSATQQIERELDPSTTYDVQVQGVNAAGTGPWSTLVQVATLTGNRQVFQFPETSYTPGVSNGIPWRRFDLGQSRIVPLSAFASTNTLATAMQIAYFIRTYGGIWRLQFTGGGGHQYILPDGLHGILAFDGTDYPFDTDSDKVNISGQNYISSDQIVALATSLPSTGDAALTLTLRDYDPTA